MSAWRSHVLGERALKHITTYLPAVHALTGFDTVSYLFGIGKAATALKILMADITSSNSVNREQMKTS